MNSKITELYGPAKVGNDTLAYCTKCKMELAHVIVSMVESRPAKVVCKTCRGQHNYKRQGDTRAASTRGSKGTRTAAPRTRIKASEYWETKMAERSKADLVPYATTGQFQKGDVVQHPQFGAGVVEDVRRGGKMVVIFREGEKILISKSGSDLP